MTQAMLHAKSPSNVRNERKTSLAALLRHARRAWPEHTAAETARGRLTRVRPNRGRSSRASCALHGDVRGVLGLHDAPSQCPVTDGKAGQYRKGAIGGQHVGHKTAA